MFKPGDRVQYEHYNNFELMETMITATFIRLVAHQRGSNTSQRALVLVDNTKKPRRIKLRSLKPYPEVKIE